MSIGKDRNRSCPQHHLKQYKKCCWDKDYWEGFTKSVVKLKDQRTQIEKEVTQYRRTP